ncbi:MurR/RpiR family transcriptional regulator [Aestuariivirga sp.]|uniref:MurR/RpiR family transcriptional regulator n=1 Tax=Aestuariivirga sp. TaxID=2650926 RepID=UPI0039E576D0
MGLAPQDYEELIRTVHDQYGGMSKAHQQIALFITQNPNDVAVKPLNAIAEACGIHASSFVRFAQSLGYDGFKEMQSLFQKRLSTAAPGFEARVKALESELSAHGQQGSKGFLHDLVLKDIASLQELLSDIDAASLDAAVNILEKADTVYLIGQLRSGPIVEFLRYVLTMLGKRAVLLDAGGGLATHMAKTIRANDALLAVAFRFYANEVVNIVEQAGARQVPVIAITDSTLSPLAKNAAALFSVPERQYSFSRSLAAPMCLAQALTLALASKLQRAHDPRIPIVTQP